MKAGSITAIALVMCTASHGQTFLDLRSQARNVDFSAAALTKPNRMGTTLPVTCTVGETFFRVSAPPGENLYGCTAANVWTLLSSRSAAALQGLPLEARAPNSAGQFYGWDAAANQFRLYTLGSLIAVAGNTIDVATESVPQYGASAAVPSSCSQYGLLYFETSGANGRKLYYCNGATYETASGGLSDPGADGLLKRSGANTTATATAGVDYYAPGTAIAPADLPLPTATAGGKVQAKACAAGTFVAAINPDASVGCGAPAAGVSTATANSYSAGAKQSFQPSGTTAGAQIVCGALPSSPAAGDMACDSNDGNKLKEWNGAAWITFGGTGVAGAAAPLTFDGTTVACPTCATSSGVNQYTGTEDARTATTLPFQVGLTSALPSTCAVGQAYFASDGSAGQRLRVCVAANVWTALAYEQGTLSARPSTCSAGQLYFATDASAGQNLSGCTSANTWTQLGGSGGGGGAAVPYGQIPGGDATVTGLPVTDFVEWDHFLFNNAISGSIGKLGWVATCASGYMGSVGSGTTYTNHPGVFQLATGGASGNSCQIYLGGATNAANTFPDLSTVASWESLWVIYPYQVDPASTTIRVGLFDINQATDYSKGSYFVEVASGNPNNTHFYLKSCTEAGVCSAVDTGVVPAATHWYKIRIFGTAAGTVQAQVSADGGAYSAPVSAAANSTVGTAPGFYIRTGTSAVRGMNVDYWGMRISGLGM